MKRAGRLVLGVSGLIVGVLLALYGLFALLYRGDSGGGRSIPVCQRSPRGPNGLLIACELIGHASESGMVGGGAVSAPSVAGPATPSTFRPDHFWNRRSALWICGPEIPSKSPDGKPCSASWNCSDATSQPALPMRRGRLPSRWREKRPRARRVFGPTIPSTAIRARRCRRRIAFSVAGPAMPSIDPL